MDRVRRRGVVLGGAVALLSGCSRTHRGPGAVPGSDTTGAATSSPTPTTVTPRVPRLPHVTSWQPDPGDLAPLAKLSAVRRIERDGSRAHHALQVVDAQYGGLLTDAASVLVVTRAWHLSGHDVVAGGHTYDVRLLRASHGWQVTAVHPSRPGPRARSLTTAARKVLTSARIHLPPAARADVGSGQVHDSVLEAMLRLSATYRIHVSVVRSGHPLYVFGTDRLSDHPQGRAFDTWAIDGRPVVHPGTPRALVEGYMHAAAAAGSYNVGGPYLLGAAPQWFSDATHHDHVHAGFVS